jgi:hypothetical protein
VPGYQAPQATIVPAIRVARVAGGLLAEGRLEARDADGPPRAQAPQQAQPLPPELAGQAAIVADAIAPGMPGTAIARALIALTQLFGMISWKEHCRHRRNRRQDHTG